MERVPLLSLDSRSLTPVTMSMLVLEVLSGGFQAICLDGLTLYLVSDVYLILAMVSVQAGLFFVSSVILLFYFASYHGLQNLNVCITIFNLGKFFVDVCTFTVLFATSGPSILPLLDLFQMGFITAILRFVLIFVYLHYGSRCESIYRQLAEER